ncbi:MAG: hypothetical protein WC496_12650, partial [Phycisphaerae bacterium]
MAILIAVETNTSMLSVANKDYITLLFKLNEILRLNKSASSYEPEPIKAIFCFSSYFIFSIIIYFQAFPSAAPFAGSQGRGT